MRNGWLVLGALSGATSVALGAFGAHALEGRLDERALGWWSTAVLYQAVHALALVQWASWSERHGRGAWPGRLFLCGALLFSGTLYAMALGGPRWLGALTPLGGGGLIAGWLAYAFAAWRAR